MNYCLLKVLVEHNIEETIQYAEFLETAIVPRLTPIGLPECQKLQFFNNGYKSAMETVLKWLQEAERHCTHYWEAQQPEIKVSPNPVTYDAPLTIATCKLCGVLR